MRDRKGEYRKEMAELLKKGYQRAKIDGAFHELSEPPTLDKKLKHDIEVVIDRIAVKAGIETRLADSLEQALKLADGVAYAEIASANSEDPTGKATLKNKAATPERLIFSQKFACPVSGFTIPEIEPRLFSFNNPAGACPTCDGLGAQLKFDAALVAPDTEKSLKEGAVAPWAKGPSPLYAQTLEALAKHFKAKPGVKWKDLPKPLRDAILNGTKEAIKFVYDDGVRRYETTKNFEGVLPNLERRWKETDSAWVREELEKYQSEAPCPACHGKRLKPEALAVKVGKLDVSEASQFSIRQARDWFEALNGKLNAKQKEIAVRILKEINDRLRFLVDVGSIIFRCRAPRARSAAAASASASPARSARG